MKALLQRVSSASVTVGAERVGEIRDCVETGGHSLDTGVVEHQAIEHGGAQPALLPGVHVDRIGRKNFVAACAQ